METDKIKPWRKQEKKRTAFSLPTPHPTKKSLTHNALVSETGWYRHGHQQIIGVQTLDISPSMDGNFMYDGVSITSNKCFWGNWLSVRKQKICFLPDTTCKNKSQMTSGPKEENQNFNTVLA